MRARPQPALGAIYGIADGAALGGAEEILAALEAMAGAGIRTLQLRVKGGMSDRELYDLVDAARRRLSGSGAALWMNDRADLAALFGLPGLHLGHEDLPPAAARCAVGEGTWIGCSTHDASGVCAAQTDPEADVVAIGPVFATATKERPHPTLGLEGVRRARRLTAKPLVAIGGIGVGEVRAVLDAGADSVAVVGALCRGSVYENARALLAAAGRA